jgi:hypothetical protein
MAVTQRWIGEELLSEFVEKVECRLYVYLYMIL